MIGAVLPAREKKAKTDIIYILAEAPWRDPWLWEAYLGVRWERVKTRQNNSKQWRPKHGHQENCLAAVDIEFTSLTFSRSQLLSSTPNGAVLTISDKGRWFTGAQQDQGLLAAIHKNLRAGLANVNLTIFQIPKASDRQFIKGLQSSISQRWESVRDSDWLKIEGNMAEPIKGLPVTKKAMEESKPVWFPWRYKWFSASSYAFALWNDVNSSQGLKCFEAIAKPT
jgi:hypothetical protein